MVGAEDKQWVLEQQPLESITLTALISADGNIAADRIDAKYIDGTGDGTAGDDVIKAGSSDANGDQVDAGANTIVGDDGADYIEAAGGDDTVTGGIGNDTIYGDMADGSVYGELNLTNTDNVQDAGGTETWNTRAVELVTLANGDLILITSERTTITDGIATYQIDNDPSSATYGQVIGGQLDTITEATNPVGYNDVEALAAVTLSNGSTYVYSAAEFNDSIGVAQLSIGGRVVLCGLIKDYNGDHKTTGPHPGLWITKRATVSGLVVYDYEPQRGAFEDEFVPLAEAGKLVGNEEMHNGLEAAPEAFCQLMRGLNHGKVVVRVGE